MNKSFLLKCSVFTIALMIFSMLLGNSITKAFFIDRGERIAVIVDQVPEDVVISSLNGLDTVYVNFKEDILTFIPDGNKIGYIVYSDVAAAGYDDHAIDYLWQGEAEAFIHWALECPISGDDREKANEYYRQIINDKVYWGNENNY